MPTQIIAIIAALLISTTPVLAQQRVTISDRCKQLQLPCPQAEVREIGKKLSELYYQTYGKKPPKTNRGINIYYTTDLPLMDRAIRAVNRQLEDSITPS
jgi:hypothetical protein